MDPNYAPQYPHQPYNGNPHMHPGELVLLRIIGQGRWQHPFHEHGNHVRILARDGNLILSADRSDNSLAGPLLFTTTTTPGLAMDGIFYWTGKGLNWDAYGHNPTSADPNAKLTCTPDANGYNTGAIPTRDQLLRVVPGSQQAAGGGSVRRCRRRRSGDPARSEHSREWRLVRRQPLSGTGRDRARRRVHRHDAALRHDRATRPTEKPASPSCGTRTTSARSPPTIFSRAE